MYYYQIHPEDMNDPRMQRLIMGGHTQGHRQPPNELLNNEHYINQMKAQTAMMVADIRQRDSELFRNALTELRMAMGTASVADGDRGSTERPPIGAAFDATNLGKLQEAYLNITLRYVKFIDTICKDDLGFDPPKGINDPPQTKEAV